MSATLEIAVIAALAVLIGVDLLIQWTLRGRRRAVDPSPAPAGIPPSAAVTETPASAAPPKLPSDRELGVLRRILRSVIAQDSREEVLREIAGVLSVGLDRGWIAIVSCDDAPRTLQVVAEHGGALGAAGLSFPLGDALLAECLRTRAPLTVDGPEAERQLPPELLQGRIVRTVTALPAIVGGRVICLLVLADRRDLPRPSEAEMHTALGLAELAGMAIDHARVTRELDAKVRELSTLYEVAGYEMATITSSSPGIGDCLERTLDLIHRLLKVDACSIMLFDECTQELYVKAGRGKGPRPVKTLRFKLGEGLAGEAALKQAPVVAFDAGNDKRFVPQPGATSTGTSIAAIPMIVQNRVVGVINVRSVASRLFQEDEVKTLQLVAARTALAVENARYHEALETERRKLQVIVETTADGIVVLDRNGVIIHANAAVGEIAGAEVRQILGNSWNTICRVKTREGTRIDDRRYPFGRMTGGDGRSLKLEFEITSATGAVRWVEAHCTAVKDAAGEVVLGVASLRDITDKRKGDLARQQMIQCVVEEVRSPLISASNTLEMMLGEALGPLNSNQKKGLTTSISNLKRVLLCNGTLTRANEGAA